MCIISFNVKSVNTYSVNKYWLDEKGVKVKTWNITALPVMELPCPHLSVLGVQKHLHRLVVDELNYFPLYDPFPTDETSQPTHCLSLFL